MIIVVLIILALCGWIYLQEWLAFKSLGDVKKGQNSSVLDMHKITPSKVYINDNTAIYTFYFVSLFAIIFPTKRLKTYTFVAVDRVITYICRN